MISQKITTFIVVPERNQLLSGAQLCLTHAAARIIYTNTITMLKKYIKISPAAVITESLFTNQELTYHFFKKADID